jgi:hypothetical protein
MDNPLGGIPLEPAPSPPDRCATAHIRHLYRRWPETLIALLAFRIAIKTR